MPAILTLQVASSLVHILKDDSRRLPAEKNQTILTLPPFSISGRMYLGSLAEYGWTGAATALLVGSLGYAAIIAFISIYECLPLMRIPGPKSKSFIFGMMKEVRDSPPCAMHMK